MTCSKRTSFGLFHLRLMSRCTSRPPHVFPCLASAVAGALCFSWGVQVCVVMRSLLCYWERGLFVSCAQYHKAPLDLSKKQSQGKLFKMISSDILNHRADWLKRNVHLQECCCFCLFMLFNVLYKFVFYVQVVLLTQFLKLSSVCRI